MNGGIASLWSIRGAIPVSPRATQAVIDRIAAALGPLDPSLIDRKEASIVWHQGLADFVLRKNWGLLGGVDSGAVRIADGELDYAVSFSHALLLCLVAAIFFGLYIGSGSAPLDGLKWGVVALLWLTGTNYVWTAFQVRRFFRKALETCG